jgi:hypothetical protein
MFGVGSLHRATPVGAPSSIMRKCGISTHKAIGVPGSRAHCGASFWVGINKVVRGVGAGERDHAPNKAGSLQYTAAVA